ncbi:MAG: hypothetical protein KAJ91_00040 [Candidatus Aenigmarchaeota archaeon]|nr:hypothetical protein [Candidatus Aenigmarchaeota archaeon]MCK5333144.1 hypothetical protein [Candidatus Aenigmarchaeota archaeon]
MKYSLRLNTFVAFLVGCCIVFPKTAHAYLDPGIGSYIFQLLLASLFGAFLVAKTYWSKLKVSLKNRFSMRKRYEKNK